METDDSHADCNKSQLIKVKNSEPQYRELVRAFHLSGEEVEAHSFDRSILNVKHEACPTSEEI